MAGHQAAMRQSGGDWVNFAGVLDRVLAGERDSGILCGGLDSEGSMIIETIVQALSDPSTLEDLLADQDE